MRNRVLILCVTVIVLVALDQMVKAQLGSYPLGSVVGSLFGGLIDLRIVYNTGGAWGVFAGNPLLLGVFSLIVCVLLLIYFVWARKNIPYMQVIGIGLIVGGGIGNAIDRFTQGYVLDYFSTTFIDFPVFNVADMGVTCGVAILIISLLMMTSSDAGSKEALIKVQQPQTELSEKRVDGSFSDNSDLAKKDRP